MRSLHFNRACVAGAVVAAVSLSAGAAQPAPTYTITNILVPPDQYSGEADTQSADVYKPHETDSASPTPSYWISSNERGDESVPPGQVTQFTNKAGITIFEYGTNKELSTLNIEKACIPVVQPNGTLMKQFGGCAPHGSRRPSAPSARHRPRRSQEARLAGDRALRPAMESDPHRLREGEEHRPRVRHAGEI